MPCNHTYPVRGRVKGKDILQHIFDGYYPRAHVVWYCIASHCIALHNALHRIAWNVTGTCAAIDAPAATSISTAGTAPDVAAIIRAVPPPCTSVESRSLFKRSKTRKHQTHTKHVKHTKHISTQAN